MMGIVVCLFIVLYVMADFYILDTRLPMCANEHTRPLFTSGDVNRALTSRVSSFSPVMHVCAVGSVLKISTLVGGFTLLQHRKMLSSDATYSLVPVQILMVSG